MSHRESLGNALPGETAPENPPRQQKSVVPLLPLSQNIAKKAESHERDYS